MFSNEAKILEAFNEMSLIVALVYDQKLSKLAAYDRISVIIEDDALAEALTPPASEIVPSWPRLR